jgi:inhibitor of KinA
MIFPLGDSAVVVGFGDEASLKTHLRVKAFSDLLERRPPDAAIEHIPALTTVTVVYDAVARGYEEFAAELRNLLEEVAEPFQAPESRLVEIPVCYGGAFGPDLGFVAEHNGLSTDDVIAIHSEPEYLVYMIGFAPGFPYLGGMSERIASPRRDSPRQAIPAGSVGIAGRQTGVYPIVTPGGWRLIGRTPLRLFRPEEDPPTLVHAGDRVAFTPIGRNRYEQLLELEE